MQFASPPIRISLQQLLQKHFKTAICGLRIRTIASMDISSDSVIALRDSSWLGCVAFLSVAMLFNRKLHGQNPQAHIGISTPP
jgi:hypothetical protein